MNKMLFIPLFAMINVASAAGIIPVGVTMDATIVKYDSNKIVVEVLAPKLNPDGKFKTPWNKIAAVFTGCRLNGVRSDRFSPRSDVKFSDMHCGMTAARSLNIDAIAVGSDHFNGLTEHAKIGSPVTVVFLKEVVVN